MNILLEWGQFLKLAYLGGLMVLLLWYAFEVPTVLAGIYLKSHLAYFYIMLNSNHIL
jgi:hypothetical protein